MAKVNKVRIQLKNVRLSFANIFEPKGFNGSDPRYSASFLISKDDDENLNKVKDAIKAVARAEWTTEQPKFKENQMCFRDGDKETWDGYADHYFVSSGNKLKVAIRDLDGTDLTIKSEDNTPGDKPLSGDYVNAVIEIWAQNNTYGKRINANLVGVQYVKKGPRFGKKEQDVFDTPKASKIEKTEDSDPFAEAIIMIETPKQEEALKEVTKLSFGAKKDVVVRPKIEEAIKDDIDALFE